MAFQHQNKQSAVCFANPKCPAHNTPALDVPPATVERAVHSQSWCRRLVQASFSAIVRGLGIAEDLQHHEREIALLKARVNPIRELVISALAERDDARPDFMRTKLHGLTTVLHEVDVFMKYIEKRKIPHVSTESETLRILDAKITSAVSAVQLSESISSLQSRRTAVADSDASLNLT